MNKYISKKAFNIEKTILDTPVPSVISEKDESYVIVRVYPIKDGTNYYDWCDEEYDNVVEYINDAIRELDLTDTYTVLGGSMYLQEETMEYIDVYDENLGDISVAMYSLHRLLPHVSSDGYTHYLNVTVLAHEDTDQCISEALESLGLQDTYKVVEVDEGVIVEDIDGFLINIIAIPIEEIETE